MIGFFVGGKGFTTSHKSGMTNTDGLASLYFSDYAKKSNKTRSQSVDDRDALLNNRLVFI